MNKFAELAAALEENSEIDSDNDVEETIQLKLDLDEYRECKICREQLIDDVVCCVKCPKWIHKQCWERQTGRKKCPWCQNSKHFRVLNPIEQTIRQQIMFNCEGCNVKQSYKKIVKHRETCPECDVVCYDCYDKIKRKDIEHHKKNTCPNRQVPCDLCQKNVPFKHMERHKKNSCPKTMSKCEQCNADMIRSKLDHHINFDCPEMEILCDDCHQYIPRKKSAEHGFGKCITKCKHCKGKHHPSKSAEHGKRKCVFGCNSCKFFGTKEDLKDHIRNHRVFCNNCCRQVPCSAMVQHKRRCKWKKCEHCSLMVMISQMQTHIGNCGSNIIRKCNQCRLRVHKDDLKKHQTICFPHWLTKSTKSIITEKQGPIATPSTEP